MVKDSQTHMPLLMMGLLSILTHYISAGLQSQPAQPDTSSSVAEVKEQLMTICIFILQLLSNDRGTILEVIFTSGLINSAVQLLDSTKLYSDSYPS